MSEDKNSTSDVPTPPPVPVAPPAPAAPTAQAPVEAQATPAPVQSTMPAGAPAPAPVCSPASEVCPQPSGFAPMQTGYMETPPIQTGAPVMQGAPFGQNQVYQQQAQAYQQSPQAYQQPAQPYQQPLQSYQQQVQPYQQPGSQANIAPSNYGQPAAPQYQTGAAPGIVAKDSNLTLAAFILCIVSCVFFGGFILPLAWMIPMTIYSWKIHKLQRKNTVAFGVCTLLFTSLIGGILLLVSPKDE